MTNEARPEKLNCEHAQKTMEFLNAIGLQVDVVPGASGFIEGIRLVDGTIQIDPNCPVSGLLHEAGHLAVIPKAYRHFMNGGLFKSFKQIFEVADFMSLEPDHPTSRALMQSSDPEVTAWAWAVGKHLEIPDELIIMDHEYDNGGADLRISLNCCAYMGIHGLMHAGFCTVRPNPYRKLAVYPKLEFWLQP